MDRPFDLRIEHDRQKLAEFLPAFDGRTLDFSAQTLVDGLRFASEYLGAPDWLVYQWGTVGPLAEGKHSSPLELKRVVTLGLELQELSKYRGFPKLLDGLRNYSQFFDTLFEIQIASVFSRLNGTTAMEFSPVHTIRGHGKSPEFDAETSIGSVSVECKCPHMFVQNAAEHFRSVAREIRSAMERTTWPRDYRLEVEIIGPLREPPTTFAERIVSAAAEARDGEAEVAVGPGRAFILPKEGPFRLTETKFGHDVMILDSNEATGLFNPRFTVLRVVNNGLDHKFVRSAGARLAEAIRQLPADRQGLIFLGSIPARIGAQAAVRRLDDAAYDAVLAIGVVDDESWTFHFREENRPRLSSLMRAGMRALYEPVG